MELERFFDALWHDYTKIAPQAARLRRLLEERGETVHNDHVAFRTFDRAPINLESLEPHLLAMGYQRFEPYHFADKHLRAYGYIHERGPRVFLSELETSQLSQSLQQAVGALCEAVDPARVGLPEVLWAGRLWPAPDYSSYLRLAEESEYAGWVAALGLHANHFTISVNELTTFSDFPAFLDWVEQQGFKLNLAGGRIKGNPSVLLEQAATLADQQPVEFADGRIEVVPTCYYEFALRHAGPDGKLYNGFVAANADKIFESTDRQS